MPFLHQHLTTLSHYTLRGIAIRLALRQKKHNQKSVWITAIVTGWQTATTRHQWLAQLSLTAQEALARLLAAEQIPAPLFWADYGPVRQTTANQHWTPPPWQAPATVSEELYYSGLLCPTPRSLARAHLVSLPVDLREVLAAEDQRPETRDKRGGRPVYLSTCLPVYPSSPGWPLCHDVGQLLIYLHNEAGGRLLQGRWLSRAQSVALNERLLAPVDVASTSDALFALAYVSGNGGRFTAAGTSDAGGLALVGRAGGGTTSLAATKLVDRRPGGSASLCPARWRCRPPLAPTPGAPPKHPGHQ